MTSAQLAAMSRQDIESIKREELADISAVSIRPDLTHEEKIWYFLEQIQNPYCFLCGNIPVKVCFTDGGPKLGQALETYFIRVKQG